jgi:ABC-type uncharacterized transport system YnjBCD ATPase subunit
MEDNFSDQSALRAAIVSARKTLDRDLVERDVLLDRVSGLEAKVAEAEEAAATFDKAAMLLNTLGEERQIEAQAMIEELVTRGLQSIFEPNLSLVISTQVRGKSTVTEFLIRSELSDGSSFETSVMDARGGGLVAVVAFLLRVTVLLLTQPVGRRFLLLDESFAHVSTEYQPGVAAFLSDLVHETGLQVVMVTHSEELAESATSVVRFEQVDGHTRLVT